MFSSLLLFSLFLNDFSKYIEGKYKGLRINNCYPTFLDVDIVMLNMFVLLYADDTILLVENACELQKAFDAVHEYCGMALALTRTVKENYTVFIEYMEGILAVNIPSKLSNSIN